MYKRNIEKKDQLIRVVAYCRVSTDHEDQINSYEAQISYFERYIKNNPSWDFIKIYADKGITGTSRKKRVEFNKMIADANSDKFDMIITKEVSRFARNTVDTLQVTRELRAMGIGVKFLNDNIFSLNSDAEFILTIMANTAQEESRKTSERCKWGLKRVMERGKVLGNRIYGYYLNEGELAINEEEAQVVRLIFDLYLQGMGIRCLGKFLEEKGIPSPDGLNSWAKTSILRMLKNEKYMGDLVQGKVIISNFLTHERQLNDQENLVVRQQNHEGIVSKEIFNKTQAEIKSRSKLEDNKKKYSNRYALSGKIECGHCHSSFHRKYWNGKKERKNVVWQCASNIRYGLKKVNSFGEEVGCDCKGIHETLLQEMFISSLGNLIEDKDQIFQELRAVIETAIRETESSKRELEQQKKELEKLINKKAKLVDLYTSGEIERTMFKELSLRYEKQTTEIHIEVDRLEEECNNVTSMEDHLSKIDTVLSRIKNFDIDSYSEEICKETLSKVIIYSREKVQFFFNNNDGCTIPVLVHQQVQQDQLDLKEFKDQLGLQEQPVQREVMRIQHLVSVSIKCEMLLSRSLPYIPMITL